MLASYESIVSGSGLWHRVSTAVIVFVLNIILLWPHLGVQCTCANDIIIRSIILKWEKKPYMLTYFDRKSLLVFRLDEPAPGLGHGWLITTNMNAVILCHMTPVSGHIFVKIDRRVCCNNQLHYDNILVSINISSIQTSKEIQNIQKSLFFTFHLVWLIWLFASCIIRSYTYKNYVRQALKYWIYMRERIHIYICDTTKFT